MAAREAGTLVRWWVSYKGVLRGWPGLDAVCIGIEAIGPTSLLISFCRAKRRSPQVGVS